MEQGMKNYGSAVASEFLGDRIVYRNLVPLDHELPGLADCVPSLGLPTGKTPRKHELDYARVVAHILQTAQHQRLPTQPIQSLVYIGDTELLDGAAFANLCQVTGWTGFAFIGDETSDPPKTRLKSCPPSSLYISNRWSDLVEFDRFCAQNHCPVESQTVVVIDLDKTILGARRRNAQTIDRARAVAMQQTLAQIIGSAFDTDAFDLTYRTFSQTEFHPFTSDNQDYLAYICLMILGGWVSLSELQCSVKQGKLRSFEQFIHQVDQLKTHLPACLVDTHNQVYACVLAGDPTPFKTFRRYEYTVTVAAMGSLPVDAPLPDLLSQEITLTQEVRRIALDWRSRGALLFGLSDKPDEASLPTPELSAQGFQPLHRTLTHAVGRLP
jgi:hypothetical protein